MGFSRKKSVPPMLRITEFQGVKVSENAEFSRGADAKNHRIPRGFLFYECENAQFHGVQDKKPEKSKGLYVKFGNSRGSELLAQNLYPQRTGYKFFLEKPI